MVGIHLYGEKYKNILSDIITAEAIPALRSNKSMLVKQVGFASPLFDYSLFTEIQRTELAALRLGPHFSSMSPYTPFFSTALSLIPLLDDAQGIKKKIEVGECICPLKLPLLIYPF